MISPLRENRPSSYFSKEGKGVIEFPPLKKGGRGNFISVCSLLLAILLLSIPSFAQSQEGFPVIPPEQRPALPNILLTDGSGVTFPLSNYSGRVIIIEFQASTCTACLKELTFLDRLQGDLQQIPLSIFSISEDATGISGAKQLIARQKLLRLRPFADANATAANALAVQGLPTSFIIDRQGRLVSVLYGPQAWDSPSFKARLRLLATQPP